MQLIGQNIKIGVQLKNGGTTLIDISQLILQNTRYSNNYITFGAET